MIIPSHISSSHSLPVPRIGTSVCALLEALSNGHVSDCFDEGPHSAALCTVALEMRTVFMQCAVVNWMQLSRYTDLMSQVTVFLFLSELDSPVGCDVRSTCIHTEHHVVRISQVGVRWADIIEGAPLDEHFELRVTRHSFALIVKLDLSDVGGVNNDHVQGQSNLALTAALMITTTTS
jgi:hypothetical protein